MFVTVREYRGIMRYPLIPKIQLWLFRRGVGKLHYVPSRRTIVWRLF